MGKVAEVLEVLTRRRPRISVEDYREKRRSAGFNDEDKLIPDGIPMEPPLGYKPSQSMVEIIRDMVRSEQLARDLDAAGVETFEEADDFEVGDEDPQMRSPWENDFDPPIKELVEEGGKEVARKKAAKKAEKPAETGEAPEGAE